MLDLISVIDLSEKTVNQLFSVAERVSSGESLPPFLKNKVIGTLFFQPSVRTRLGFCVAATKLEGNIVGFSGLNESRSLPGYDESHSDCIRAAAQMTDCVIVRTFESGLLSDLAPKLEVPIINAGEGWNEHPSQGLADLFTMHRRLGGLGGKKFGFLGNPAARSFKSQLIGLAKLKAAKVLILDIYRSELCDNLKLYLEESGVKIEFSENAREIFCDCDAVSILPFDLSDLGVSPHEVRPSSKEAGLYTIDIAFLEQVKNNVLVLHAGPRRHEMDASADADDRVLIWHQVRESLAMRQAIFALCFGTIDGISS